MESVPKQNSIAKCMNRGVLHALQRAFSAETWRRWPHRRFNWSVEWCDRGYQWAIKTSELPAVIRRNISRFLLALRRIRLSCCPVILPAPRVKKFSGEEGRRGLLRKGCV